ncbi:MAG: GNAT family N-acetyltransferase [Alphaproteobacteria bacterium]|nr:GNAT family N-acetyltransferase [Alphaproteobacteria bacterium]MBV8407191.1 GNAT family N-acetyltransferase [Alphaproteobacteria bacterium]
MSGALALRALGALDLDIAAALHADAFAALGEARWSRRDLAELMASPGVAGLLIEADRQPVGFALWRRAAAEAELLTLAVSPTHRRRGAGGRLVAAVVRNAREAGAIELFLEVGIDNLPALSLYEKAGFFKVGCRAAYYHRAAGPAADAVVMRLGLA